MGLWIKYACLDQMLERDERKLKNWTDVFYGATPTGNQIYFLSTFPTVKVSRRDIAPTLFSLFWRRL